MNGAPERLMKIPHLKSEMGVTYPHPAQPADSASSLFEGDSVVDIPQDTFIP